MANYYIYLDERLKGDTFYVGFMLIHGDSLSKLEQDFTMFIKKIKFTKKSFHYHQNSKSTRSRFIQFIKSLKLRLHF
jgi:hypothetical protein